jgi:hypothetical protein
VLGWASATSYNWYSIAPDWLLEEVAGSDGGSGQASALSELAARITAGAAGEGRTARLVEQGLARQADASRPWQVGWGDVIDAAIGRGLVAPEQIEAYLSRACEFSLRTRERANAGGQLQVGAWVKPLRGGTGTGILVQMRLLSVRLGEIPLARAGSSGASRLYLSGQGSMGGSSQSVTVQGEPGEHRLELEIEASLGHGRGLSTQGVFSDPKPPSDVVLRRVLSGEIEVLAADAPLVALVEDPSLAGAIRSAMRATSFRSGDASESGVDLEGSLSAQDLPIACAFEVLVRVGDVEHPWGTAVFPAGGGYGVGLSGRIDAPVGETVDLVLRSSERVLLTGSELESAWKGEIVIEGVPVARAGK